MPACLRCAVVCDSLLLPDWRIRCLRLLAAVDGVRLALILDPAAGADPAPPSLWSLYWTRRVTAAARALRACHVHQAFPDMPVSSLPAGDLRQFAGAADLVLHFGTRPISDERLLLARYGVWTFSFDEELRRSHRPPAFREILECAPLTHFSLVRLVNAGRWVSLLRGTIATVTDSYPRALDTLLYAGVGWPARVCREIHHGTAAYLDAPPVGSPSQAAGPPRDGQVVRLAALTLRSRVSTAARRLLSEDHWNVGIARAPIERFLHPGALPSISWLPERPPSRYIADPFVLSDDGTLSLLVEEFRAAAGRGSITALSVTPDGSIIDQRPAIVAAHHLAYPCVVRHAGESYCVPDTGRRGEVVLYRAGELAGGWLPVATLVQGVAAADPTLCAYGGRWWLFCAGRRRSAAPGLRLRESGVRSTLFAWYADDLLGPWREHPANPLKIDVRSARPAGPFFTHNGVLYRPAQDCSRTYGGAVVINRIVTLTPTEFVEEPVARVDPHPRYPDGLHTLSAAGDFTILDGNRRTLLWYAGLLRLMHMMTRTGER